MVKEGLLKEALELAGSADPKDVRDALAKMDIKGGPATIQIGQRVDFDERGHNMYAKLGLNQWRNGELATVWPESDSSAPIVYPIPDWSKRK